MTTYKYYIIKECVRGSMSCQVLSSIAMYVQHKSNDIIININDTDPLHIYVFECNPT